MGSKLLVSLATLLTTSHYTKTTHATDLTRSISNPQYPKLIHAMQPVLLRCLKTLAPLPLLSPRSSTSSVRPTVVTSGREEVEDLFPQAVRLICIGQNSDELGTSQMSPTRT